MAKKAARKAAKRVAPQDFSVGQRLRYIRENRKMTQAELAHLAKLTQATIANIESGKKEPSLSAIERIANALDIHIATLFSADDVFVIDLKRMRRKYTRAGDLTPHLYMAIGQILKYAKDIGF